MEKQLSLLDVPSNKELQSSQEPQEKTPTPTFVKQPRWQIFIDGAARGNPGPSGAGIYVADHQKPLIQKGIYLETKTNNQAEYLALLLGLYFTFTYCSAHKITLPYLHIISDSELLIKQLNGFYSVKNSVLKEFHATALRILENHPCTFTHVLREHNKQADALANKGIDKRTKIPTDFFKFMSDYNPLITSLLV